MSTRSRGVRRLGALALTGVLALAAAPVQAQQAEPVTSSAVGTADTVLDLGALALSGLPVNLGEITLPALRSYASSDADAVRNVLGAGQRYALAEIALPLVEPARATSNGATSVPGSSSGLPAGLGTITAGALQAIDDGTEVRASVASLEALLGLQALGLGVGAPEPILARVNPQQSTSLNGVDLSGLTLGLGDILPRELLEQLPLSVLLDLVEGLTGDLPVDIQGLIDQLEAAGVNVEAAAAAVDTAQAGVDSLQAQISTQVGTIESQREQAVADAMAGVASATAAVTAAQAQAASAEQQLAAALCGAVPLPECSRLQEAVNQANAQVVSATNDLNTAQLALAGAVDELDDAIVTGLEDDLQRAIDGLQVALGDLTDELLDLIDTALELDIEGLIEGLLDLLDSTEILSVGELRIGVSAVANGTSSNASALCTIDDVAVLGAPLSVSTCDQLDTVLGGVLVAIEDLLGNLPIVNDALDGVVTVDTPNITVTERDARDGAYYVASAKIEGLGLTVESLNLIDTVDGVLTELLATVDGALGVLPVDLPVDVTGQVRSTLDEVRRQLNALPTGALLDSLATPGLDLTLLDEISAKADFASACTFSTGEDSPLIQRADGNGRIGTALGVSQCVFDATDTVVISRADVYADSLSGAPLANVRQAPVLLTPTDDLTDEVATEIARLGARNVVLLGGVEALDESVEAEARQLGYNVERFGGANRFHTAAIISEQLGGTATTAFITEGGAATPDRGWPDAVSAAPYAAFSQQPILLATAVSLPEETKQALDRMAITEAIVVGGPAAIGDAVFTELQTRGNGPRRLAGSNRYETSVAVYREAVAQGMNAEVLFLATGNNWPDALITGPAAAANGQTFMLVDGSSLDASPAIRNEIAANTSVIKNIRLVGGPSTISTDVESQLTALFAQ